MPAHITDLSGIAPKMDDVAISQTEGCLKAFRCPTDCFAAIGKEASCRCKEELPTVVVFSNIAAAEQNTGGYCWSTPRRRLKPLPDVLLYFWHYSNTTSSIKEDMLPARSEGIGTRRRCVV